jgi:tetratricopeptide (TPR) repeat protein
LAQLGRANEAAGHFRKVLASEPDNAKVHDNLALVLSEPGETNEAVRHFAELVRLKPDDARAHYDLALAELDIGQDGPALAHLRRALTLQPTLLTQINNRAWLLATHPDASARNGKKAIVLARAVLEDPGLRRSWVLDTLAAAYAEVGQFASATNYAKQALFLARAADDLALGEEISHRLALYHQGQPYREPPRKP